MELYHFTSEGVYQSVQGLGYFAPNGDVPITPDGGFRALWLTTDPTFENQLWTQGGPKDQVRFMFDLEDDKPGLAKWEDVAEAFQMTNKWKNALEQSGGDPSKWYIYIRNIPLAEAKRIDFKNDMLSLKEQENGSTEGHS